jgi:iron complex outermembrane recepter protein
LVHHRKANMTFQLKLLPFALISCGVFAQTTPPERVEVQGKSEVELKPALQTQDLQFGVFGKQALIDVPASVGSIPRALIESQQARSLRDLTALDASVAEDYAPEGYYDSVQIRGLPLDPWNSYRINGLRISHDAAVALENKERVDILKGLAGLQAGFGRAGGVINYVTKRANADVSAVALNANSFGNVLTQIDLGRKLGEIGVRVNVANEDLTSYAANTKGKRHFASVALDWQLSPALKLEFDLEAQRRQQKSVPGLQIQDDGTLPPLISPRTQLNDQAWAKPVDIRSQTLGARLLYQVNPDWQIKLAAQQMHRTANDRVAFPYGFYAGGTYDLYDYRSEGETRKPSTVELSASGRLSTGSIEHSLTLAASSFTNTMLNPDYAFNFVGTGSLATRVQFAPDASLSYEGVRYSQSENALLLHDAIQWSPSLRTDIGARWLQLARTTSTASGYGATDWQTRALTPYAAVQLKPAASLAFYAQAASALEQGDSAPYGTKNQGELLLPAKSKQFEVGSKWEPSRNLLLTAAVFQTNKPFETVNDTNTWAHQGRLTHRGLELGISGQFSPQWASFASLAYIDSSQSESADPARNGREKANVAKLRLSALLEYRRQSLAANVKLQAVSKRAADDANTVYAPGYVVFGAGLRLGFLSRFEALLNVENIGNTRYWKDVGGGYAHLGAPRTASLGLRASF